ncbi:MAG: rhomboid family intramembrane serine protease [Candidatus Eremiobacterota bacterium]
MVITRSTEVPSLARGVERLRPSQPLIAGAPGTRGEGQEGGILETVKARASGPAGMLGAFWAAEAVDTVLGGQLDQFGIVPRTLDGLVGVGAAPFLHAGFGHLIGNSVPFLATGLMVGLSGKHKFRDVTIISALVGGLGTWALGRNATHLGASGLVYGYLGYLLTRGIVEKKPLPIALSLLAGGLYGGLLWGVLPGVPGVSWEGHLFGFLGGVLAARVLPTQESRPETREGS